MSRTQFQFGFVACLAEGETAIVTTRTAIDAVVYRWCSFDLLNGRVLSEGEDKSSSFEILHRPRRGDLLPVGDVRVLVRALKAITFSVAVLCESYRYNLYGAPRFAACHCVTCERTFYVADTNQRESAAHECEGAPTRSLEAARAHGAVL